MKANKAQLDKALKTPGGSRFFLLHGPDEAGSRALMKALVAAIGSDAERVELSAGDLRADPARLSDEAASISLFGGARYVLVELAGDEIMPAVEALLEAPTAGNPVILLAGGLKGGSKLLKLALADPNVIAYASYVPDGRDADRLVAEAAREEGLDVRPDVARQISEGAGGNRAVIAQEIAKYALYLDAAPDRPKLLDRETLEAVGAASDEGDLSRLVEAVAGGKPDLVEAELRRLSAVGIEGIPLVRAMLRRMTLLAKMRGEVEKGNSVSSVMASQGKAIFWKEKDAVAAQLGRWRSDLLAKGMSRLLDAERHAKASGGLGPIAVDEELFAIARQAARLR